MRKHFIVSTELLCVLTGLVSLTIYSLLCADFLDQKIGFTLLNFILLLFLITEMNFVRVKHPNRWILNPVVFCSGTTFAIYFGLTNILYYFPDNIINIVGISSTITLAMNKIMFLVIIGAIAMWLGYWSSTSNRVLNSRFITNTQYKYFNQDQKPKFWVIPTLYIIANISRLIEIWLGIYGYSGNYERILATASYSQFLTILDNAGSLALIITLLQYYVDNHSKLIKFYYVTILCGEVFWGIMSGMKIGIIIPFLCIFITQYLRLNRISKIWLILAPLVIFSAYFIVEPFRDERINNPNFEANSVTGIITAIVDAQKHKYDEKHNQNVKEYDEREYIIKQEADAATYLKFIRRINLTFDASVGIEFADNNKELPPGSPDFLKETLEAPIAAYIPRFLWQGKPLQNVGLWYTQVVFDQPYSYSSTAMSIFTNLYFVGGIIAIFLGMFFIGAIQRVIFFMSRPWISSAGAVVYMGLMSNLEIIAESVTLTIIVSICRIIPLVFILQSIIYQHNFKNKRNHRL